MKNNGTPTKESAIYVHIPFCKARCGYCAFSSCCDYSLLDSYFDKIEEEMKRYSNKDIAITTIYLGGGTPSSIGVRHLNRVFAMLNRYFNISGVSEITVECNPESAAKDVLECLKRNGVTRLSFGLQSVNDSTLKKIGRLHNFDTFLCALNSACELGFKNINADLILGLPEAKQEFFKSVDVAAELSITHISVYALEIHGNSSFARLCKAYNYDDDDLADMYDYAFSALSSKGFNRYETSNFAKKGCACKHNLNYWREGRYLAFGASASGFVGNTRYTNVYGIYDYLKLPIEELRAETEDLSSEAQAQEYVMLGLRLDSGISLADFSSTYNEDFFIRFPSANKLIEQGFLKIDDDRLFVPSEKFYVVNSILCELLDF